MLTNYPNGLSSFGVPVFPTPEFAPGSRHWFVSSVLGRGANDGESPDTPFATVDQAINKMRASYGDTIHVLPGHTESITGATSLVPDTAGINIIGYGIGSMRPTFNFTATSSKIILSGANSRLRNLLLRNDTAIDVVLGLHVTGAGCILEGVEIREEGATKQFALPLHIAAADVLVDGYIFRGAAGNATVTGLRMSGADRLEIRRSHIYGAFQGAEDATGAIQSLTTANLRVNIHHNQVENMDGTSEAGIVFVATDTGFVWENFIAVPTGDFGQGIIADTAMRQYNNYVVDVATERGAPEGTASA